MSKNRRFCPNCGSTNVEPDTSNRAEVFFSGGNPNKWQCNECSYTGLMPEEKPEEDIDRVSDSGKEKIKFESNSEYPREDTGFGEAYLKYLIYVTIPVITVYILYQLLI